MDDRRVLKTRESLFDALKTLMDQKKYSKITIQDIIDEANVGRSTFYSHFETKDDLLFASIEKYLGYLNEYILNLVERTSTEEALISTQDLFEHIQENKRVIRSLFYGEGTEYFVNRAFIYWNDAIQAFLKKTHHAGTINDVPLEIMANHISNTLISLLKYWLAEKINYSPSEMDHYFQKLIRPLLE